MSAVVNLVTIIAMLTHAVVGCCSHHHHVACGEHAQRSADGKHAVRACSHSHSGPSAETGCDHDRHGSPELCRPHPDSAICADARCVFVKSSFQPVSLAPVESAVDVAADLASAIASGQALADRALPADSIRLRGSAVAVCAQLQVWAL